MGIQSLKPILFYQQLISLMPHKQPQSAMCEHSTDLRYQLFPVSETNIWLDISGQDGEETKLYLCWKTDIGFITIWMYNSCMIQCCVSLVVCFTKPMHKPPEKCFSFIPSPWVSDIRPLHQFIEIISLFFFNIWQFYTIFFLFSFLTLVSFNET